MTTARIRGVERVYLIADSIHQYGPQLYQVTDDMTFGHLIAEVCRMKPPMFEWYLVDRNKGKLLMKLMHVELTTLYLFARLRYTTVE